MTPANDNEPRSPAQHRAIPIITRLRRAGRQGDVASLARFAIPAEMPEGANDGMDGFGVDTVYEIRPTENEIARACMKPDQDGKIGLRFDKRGAITAWRATDNDGDPVLDPNGREKWFKAREGYRQSKGSRRKSQKVLAQHSAAHLSLRGSGAFSERSQYRESQSDGQDYWRTRHAMMCIAMVGENQDARVGIDRRGLGSQVSFTQARSNAGLPPAERCPTAVARGAGFLAGTVAGNETASAGSFVGAPDAFENAIAAKIDAPRIEAGLGEHADVLNDSLDGLTARELAAQRGWGNSKGAEERAVRAQDRALAALAEVQRKIAA
jgi:hypothetical protein